MSPTTAYWDDARGKRHSAGTFASKKAADNAWRNAEALHVSGQPGEPRAGRIRFTDYVDGQWMPNHVMEPTTRQSYRYNLQRHITPWFGPMRMGDILPVHVREWVISLIADDVTPATIRHQKIILSAIFTTALNDFVIRLHPCRGVKTPTVPVKEYRILTPAEIAQLLLALPNDPARLVVDTFIGTGLRWGELAELRPSDLNPTSGVLTVARAVVELQPEDHPTGDRFLIKPYPKSTHSRRFRLDPTLITAITTHINHHQLGADDLLFPYLALAAKLEPNCVSVRPANMTSDLSQGGTDHDLVDMTNPAPGNPESSDPCPGDTDAGGSDAGFTESNTSGRSYRHGTLSAYTAGTCRCDHCRTAFATYRARRRTQGHDNPRAKRKPPHTDGHLPRNWWRTQIWYPACDSAEISPRPRTHDLRHSHASWLLAGGADLETVRQRLGHQSITTTGRYVHTLPTADDTALAALNRTRNAT